MSKGDSLLTARLSDAVASSAKRQFPSFLGFLNEYEISAALSYLKRESISNYRLCGGYENSERCLLAIAGGNFEIEDYYFPISAISIKYKKDFNLSHRDFLGALMGLGIKREAVGDILSSSGYAVVFVKDEIKSYILSQLQKIGSVGVRAYEYDGVDLPKAHSTELVNCTVASLRLDNVISAVVPLSREKSSALIKQGLVFVNSLTAESVSRAVKAGDKISVRGSGKFIVKECFGVTKKGRLKLIIEKYK